MTVASRVATIDRKTNETQVSVSLGLDGSGKADVQTGVGFLDHMLELFARHALFDLTVRCEGDLHVDQHHSVEDVGIALGQAFARALGDKKGIARYASFDLPMDETLSRVSIDISGRPFLVFRTTFPREKIGTFDTELVREWFQAFAIQAGITLHVETFYGENAHHIAESCYKGLARALRQAVSLDPREAGRVPSTKGLL
jgi:imidazoleglycerol-phosphate dehydratase